MFKKLQNLLFEEEEIDDVEEDEVVPQPVVKKKVERPVEHATPVVQPKATMNRIDVTQQIQTPVQPTYNDSSVNTSGSVFRTQPQVEKAQPVVETPVQEKPRTIGLTVDDLAKDSTPAPSSPIYTSVKTTPSKASKSTKKSTAYEFNPVISPIFGVDEKDVDAVTNTGKQPVRKSSSKDEYVSKVISPMYGSNIEVQPTSVQPAVEESTHYEEPVQSFNEKPADDEIPEFSLDDILSIRDTANEEVATKEEVDDEIIEDDSDSVLVPKQQAFKSLK